ncbi:MAG: hypothetical protein E6Q43_03095 [Dokdonella sp.]|nr:MAG: hypothetical protein EYC71_06110 [Gammaproteobacteria bacterium]TXI75714.1 MAG: hypothetical protein E6Q43_03095 [Dokdonella sp.]
MLKSILLALAVVLSMPAVADKSADEKAGNAKKAIASMLVRGHLVIGTDGLVEEHDLDAKAKLTPEMRAFVGEAISNWRFEPVKLNGEVARARVAMSLRLVANKSNDEAYSFRIAGTYFGNREEEPETNSVRVATRYLPKYPGELIGWRASGIVYLLLQVGPDGSVMNIGSEQVDLRLVGTDAQMELIRETFAKAAIRAVRKWKFHPPTTGPDVTASSWLVRQPIDFGMSTEKRVEPGNWMTYVPGPRTQDFPWAGQDLQTVGSPDALPDGGLYALQQGAKLLTPLSP